MCSPPENLYEFYYTFVLQSDIFSLYSNDNIFVWNKSCPDPPKYSYSLNSSKGQKKGGTYLISYALDEFEMRRQIALCLLHKNKCGVVYLHYILYNFIPFLVVERRESFCTSVGNIFTTVFDSFFKMDRIKWNIKETKI